MRKSMVLGLSMLVTLIWASLAFAAEPAAGAAGTFIIIALAAYPPSPTRIKSPQLHPIFTRRERLS